VIVAGAVALMVRGDGPVRSLARSDAPGDMAARRSSVLGWWVIAGGRPRRGRAWARAVTLTAAQLTIVRERWSSRARAREGWDPFGAVRPLPPAQRRVVQAAEERGQFRSGAHDLSQDRPDLRRARDCGRVEGYGGSGRAPPHLSNEKLCSDVAPGPGLRNRDPAYVSGPLP